MKNKLFIVLSLLFFVSGCAQNNEENKPIHCSFYSENYSVEDVIKYFDEVVLDSEYSSGDGDVTLVQKWEGPIYYVMEGHSEKDRLILEGLFDELNKIDGFPGIYKSDGLVSTTIDFYDDKDIEIFRVCLFLHKAFLV